ncbi:MAG: PUA domain-containing protein [Candidatus Bathyarchaeia archaeon]|nr:pseudouridine synthase [Candidatus Bathyarchaeota archaeon]
MFGREFVLEKIRKIADYQFGKGIGEALFPDNVEVVFSRRTGRIKYVYLDGELLAALNPLTGLFTLTLKGARRVFEAMEPKRLWVKVSDEAASFVEEGSDVFAKYVVDADPEIRPGEEVIIINNNGEVIAVGKSVLSGMEMKFFSRGVAVKVRRGGGEK